MKKLKKKEKKEKKSFVSNLLHDELNSLKTIPKLLKTDYKQNKT